MGHVTVQRLPIQILAEPRSICILHVHGFELLDVGSVASLVALIHAVHGPGENHQRRGSIHDDVDFQPVPLICRKEVRINLVYVFQKEGFLEPQRDYHEDFRQFHERPQNEETHVGRPVNVFYLHKRGKVKLCLRRVLTDLWPM